MLGVVSPSRLKNEDPDLKTLCLQVLASAEFGCIHAKYNRLAAAFVDAGVVPAAPVDNMRRTLERDTTYYRVASNLTAALFRPGEHDAPTRFLLQASRTPFPTSAVRTVRHELLHLGAALNNQEDVLAHEVLVQLLTTPEVFLGFGSVVFALFLSGSIALFARLLK